MQRDRSFASYEDPEARYDQRPSVWVRPEGDWGAGRVELMQFHSPDETNDNVVAYWVPERLPAAGQPLTLSYSMLWQGSDQQSPPRQGRVLQSRLGRGLERPQPGEWQFHIDYAGGPLDGLSAVATPQAFVTSSDNARVLLANVYRNPATKGWRLNLRFSVSMPSSPSPCRPSTGRPPHIPRGANGPTVSGHGQATGKRRQRRSRDSEVR
eukprot:TRINITY_DN11050_c0_g1_i1.p1 TRINITY_DN11050_c0_g1~~TRINITY_DN11050_c0_g1_i1.p1  ORF type:complete len:210 (-),score=4.44 TRINITY_DN11050_c0_g1_i1:80-709(-)